MSNFYVFIRNPRISFVCFYLLLHVNALQAQWIQTDGPYGGVANCVAVHNGYVFAGIKGAGIYRSADDSSHWTRVYESGIYDVIYSFAVIGTDIFAGTLGGILKSTDNGNSWNFCDNYGARYCMALIARPNGLGGTNLFAGSFGAFLSTDSGSTWTAINSGLTNPNDSGLTYINVYALIANDSNLFAGTYGGMFRSTDNGVNWTAINNGLPNDQFQALAVNDSMLFAASGNNGVFQSSDNGSNWTSVITLPQFKKLLSFAILPSGSGGKSLFAGAQGRDGIYRSDDNGASWVATQTPPFNRYVWSIVASPADSITSGMKFYAATSGGVALSTDYGVTWTEINYGINACNISHIVVIDTILFAGTTGNGVFRSSDNGASWTNVTEGLTNFNLFTLAAIGTDLFVGTNGKIYRSTDNGSHWFAANARQGNPSVAFTAILDSEGIVAYLFSAGGSSGVSRSTDNWESWISVNNGLPVSNKSIRSFAVNGTNLLGGNPWGGCFLSTDFGTNWVEVNTGLTDIHITALTVSDTNLFAGTPSGVFRSADNGTSWTAVNDGLENKSVTSFAVSGANIFAGTNYDVYLSTNNGANWTPVNTGLYVTSLAMTGNHLFVGTPAGFATDSLIPNEGMRDRPDFYSTSKNMKMFSERN
ncbi:MAG: hypothetical protein WCW40_07935, partial [Bacteroidota bacterium]